MKTLKYFVMSFLLIAPLFASDNIDQRTSPAADAQQEAGDQTVDNRFKLEMLISRSRSQKPQKLDLDIFVITEAMRPSFEQGIEFTPEMLSHAKLLASIQGVPHQREAKENEARRKRYLDSIQAVAHERQERQEQAEQEKSMEAVVAIQNK